MRKKERAISDKQQSFVDYYCTTANYNASEAYRMANYSQVGADANAHRMMVKDSIKQAILNKQAELRAKSGFKVEDVHKLYDRAYLKAEEKAQTGSMVGAATGIARLYGMDKDAGKPSIAVINVISYAGAGGVQSPPKVIDKLSKEIEDG